MATQSEKEALAGKYGMNMSDLEALLEANPELADSLSRSFGASLMPGMDVPRGQSVGPYGAYVASSPLSRLAQGGMEGYKVGAQQAGQRALLEALRGGGPAAGSVMESPQAGGAMGDNDAQMGGGMFGDTTEDPMAPQPVPDMMGGAQATGVPTPPPSPTLQNPPAGAQPLPPPMPPEGWQGPMTNPAMGNHGAPTDLRAGSYRGQALSGKQVYGVGMPETPEERKRRLARIMGMDMDIAP